MIRYLLLCWCLALAWPAHTLLAQPPTQEEEIQRDLGQITSLIEGQQYAKAASLIEKHLAVLHSVLADDRPTLKQFLDVLVLCYDKTGDQARKARAEDLIEKWVTLPDAWQNVYNQGDAFWAEKAYAEAADYYRQSLPYAEKAFGKVSQAYWASISDLGLALKYTGQYAEAEAPLREANGLSEQLYGMASLQYARTATNLGSLMMDLERTAEAEPLLVAARHLYARLKGLETEDYAAACRRLGLLYSSARPDTAAKYFQEAKGILAKVLPPAHASYVQVCEDLSDLYQAQERYPEAERELAALCSIIGPTHPRHPEFLLYRMKACVAQDEYARAEALATEIQQRLLQQPDADLAASLLFERVLLRIAEGQYGQAVQLGRQLQEDCQKKGEQDQGFCLRAANNLAMALLKNGDYQEALALFEQNRRRKAATAQKPLDYAHTLLNIGMTYSSLTLYETADKYYLEVQDIYTKTIGTEHPDYAQLCMNMAVVADNMSDYVRAEQLYAQARRILLHHRQQQTALYRQLCHNMGGFYQSVGVMAEAEKYYLEALAVSAAVHGTDHPDYAHTCSSLGMFYLLQDRQYDKAEKWLGQSMTIYEKSLNTSTLPYTFTCSSLGWLYADQGKYAEAELFFRKAEAVQSRIMQGENTYHIGTLSALANLHIQRRQWTQAGQYYEKASQLLTRLCGPQAYEHGVMASNLATFHHLNGQNAKALQHWKTAQQVFLGQISRNFSYLSEKEKTAFYQRIAPHFEEFFDFVARQHTRYPELAGDAFQLAVATKGLLFRSTDKVRLRILNSGDSSLIRLYRDWKAEKELLSQYYGLPAAEQAKRSAFISDREARANEMEKNLSLRSELFARSREEEIPRWQQIRQKLKAGEAAIEILRVRLYGLLQWTDTVRYMALILRPDTREQPDLVLLPNGNELETKYLKYYRNAIQTKVTDEESYQQYWEPIARRLVGVQKVYVSADGVYHQISLGSLYHPATGQYLLDELDIQLVGNTRDLIAKKQSRKPLTGAQLIGFPAFNDEAAPDPEQARNLIGLDTTQRFFNGATIHLLPGTRTEIQNLQKIITRTRIPVSAYLEDEATERLIKSLQNPQILHIATHGFFLPDVQHGSAMGVQSADTRHPLLRSGLLLANAKNALSQGGDGILTAYEAMNLALDDTELVALSACETGLGDLLNGQGVYGLQRAFQAAGAQTVLMSLWTVSDEATQALMSQFYENWLLQRQPVRTAFRNAQMTLRQKYPDPYYWSAFVLVGE